MKQIGFKRQRFQQLIALFLVIAVSGCGQMGDLYLPDAQVNVLSK